LLHTYIVTIVVYYCILLLYVCCRVSLMVILKFR